MNTICIIYGFAEGRYISAGMRKALRGHGFKVVKAPSEASVLLAHSGGCYMLPQSHNAKLVVLVDPPMWLDRKPLKGLPAKLRNEDRTAYWYKKTAFNLWYLASRPARWFRMGRFIKLDAINTLNAKTVVIRIKDDSFAHPEHVLARVSECEWTVCSLEGGHDDLWERPDRYVKLIDSVI